MTDSTLSPAPPSRDALAALLNQAAEGEPLLADRPVAEVGWGSQRIDFANGWRLCVWWLPGERLDRLWAASAPDGGCWTYGCDRWPDWQAGPGAVPPSWHGMATGRSAPAKAVSRRTIPLSYHFILRAQHWGRQECWRT